jgi:carbonic anhydrase
MQSMNRRRTLRILAAGALATVPLRTSGSEARAPWSYEGLNGPETWGSLKSDYAWCSVGREQSPIDLSDAVTADLAPPSIIYSVGGARVTNNGHTLEVAPSAGNYIRIDSVRYDLIQLNFHGPSEHSVAGRRFAMDAQFVHLHRPTGRIAVLAAFMSPTTFPNPFIDQIWSVASRDPGGEAMATDLLNPESLLPPPGQRNYWRYAGSLTTPPCSETVTWIVFKRPISIGLAQVEMFKSMFPMNARPIQPLGRRFLLQS